MCFSYVQKNLDQLNENPPVFGDITRHQCAYIVNNLTNHMGYVVAYERGYVENIFK